MRAIGLTRNIEAATAHRTAIVRQRIIHLSLSLTHSRWAFFKTIYLWDKFWIAPDQKWNSRLRVPWVRFLIFILNLKKKKEVVFLLHVFALKIKIMLIFYLTNYHISLYWVWILKIKSLNIVYSYYILHACKFSKSSKIN